MYACKRCADIVGFCGSLLARICSSLSGWTPLVPRPPWLGSNHRAFPRSIGSGSYLLRNLAAHSASTVDRSPNDSRIETLGELHDPCFVQREHRFQLTRGYLHGLCQAGSCGFPTKPPAKVR